MNIEELIAAAQANADKAAKPVAVDVPGLGRLHVRKRTIKEFEDLATAKNDKDKDGVKANGETPVVQGLFGPALARILCNEDGTRFPVEQTDLLTDLLSRQPEEVFHALINAADGKSEDKAAETGN